MSDNEERIASALPAVPPRTNDVSRSFSARLLQPIAGFLVLLVGCSSPESPSQDLTSVVAQPVTNRTAPFTNVTDYGAIPDDNIDDTKPILQAILAAGASPAYPLGAGGTVYFPPGVFLIHSLDLGGGLCANAGSREGLTLLGSGAREPESPSGGTVLAWNGANPGNCSLDGGTGGLGTAMINASGLHMTIENMTLNGGGLAPSLLQLWYQSSLTTVKNVTFQSSAPGTPLVQLDGTRSDNVAVCAGGYCNSSTGHPGGLEVDSVVFENVRFTGPPLQYAHPQSGLEVTGSNAFRIKVRDSQFQNADYGVHVVGGGGVDIENCQFTDALAAIWIEGSAQTMTISNSYTEYPNQAPFIPFLKNSESPTDNTTATVTLINNQINTYDTIDWFPRQPLVLIGNTLKGNVNIWPSSAGKQRILAVGNAFDPSATFVGNTALVDQVGSFVSGVSVTTLSNLKMSGPIALGDNAQFLHRVTAAANQPYNPLPTLSPLNWDDVQVPTLLADTTYVVSGDKANAGVHMRFTMTKGTPHSLTLCDWSKVCDASHAIIKLGGSPGTVGWVDLVLARDPNSGTNTLQWNVSAWGNN